MNIHRLFRLCGLLFLAASLSGCANRSYFDIRHGNGYGYRTFYSPLPHGGGHSDLTYTPPGGKRGVVLPYSGPSLYGEAVVHDDLIVFVEIRFVEIQHGLEIQLSKVYAAKAGPPAIDFTKSACRAAKRVSGVPDDASYFLEKTEQTELGMRIHFVRWETKSEFPETLSAVLTWQELEELVANIRANGEVHSRHGVKYYVDK